MSYTCGDCLYFQSHNIDSRGMGYCTQRSDRFFSSEWACGYFKHVDPDKRSSANNEHPVTFMRKANTSPKYYSMNC